MKKIITAIITSSLSIIQPLSASEMLPTIYQAENLEEFAKQILCSNGIFDIHKARHFLSQIKTDMKNQHGVEIDINLAINETIKIMTETGRFSQSEIATAQEFYAQLFESNKETKESWFFGKKKEKRKKIKQKEFVLPDKMASGFILMLGGALLYIIPSGFTQALGTGMITTGLYAVIDGARDGEKPYYVDSETGRPIDQISDPSVGVGIGF